MLPEVPGRHILALKDGKTFPNTRAFKLILRYKSAYGDTNSGRKHNLKALVTCYLDLEANQRGVNACATTLPAFSRRLRSSSSKTLFSTPLERHLSG